MAKDIRVIIIKLADRLAQYENTEIHDKGEAGVKALGNP